MNHIYRHVWSRIHNALIAVAEIAGSVSPKSGPRRAGVRVSDSPDGAQCVHLVRALALLLAGVSPAALALPAGGHVQRGQATIHVKGHTLTVDQKTHKAIVNWQKFGIKPDESVDFDQPGISSIALNRVTGGDSSKIMGHLNANGQLFLVNPAGITFGQGASVDVGGIVASTLNISNKSFLSGNYQFQGHSSAGVTNHGAINTSGGGSVAFIGHRVTNQGTISTPGGTTTLGAGRRVDLTLAGDHLLHFAVKQAALHAAAKNGGLIKANNGGKVVLSARAKNAALQTVVNNTGVVRAHSVGSKQGHIALLGGPSGTTRVAGTLDAGAPKTGDGGTIETSGAHVQVANDATITTQAAHGTAGQWTIDPSNFTIASSGGDITGTKLSSELSSNSVTIKSSQGSTSGKGDINVEAPVSWSSNKLTLSAYRDIHVNATMNVTSNGALAFEFGQGSSNGTINGTPATDQVNSPVNLASNTSFTTKFGSNGRVQSYSIVNSLGSPGTTNSNTLQGMGASSNLSGNYVLGSDINAKPTGTNSSTWGTKGFTPVGSNSNNAFTGTFDGLDHTIKNLTINRPNANNVGLFGYAKGSAIRNVGLVGGSVSGKEYAGDLVGKNTSNASIRNVHAAGNVTASGTSNSTNAAGGLIGYNDSSISNAYATGNVTASGTNNYYLEAGGLVGSNEGQISNAYATGTVTASGDSNSSNTAGGLVGYNDSSISNAYATGNVTASGNYNLILKAGGVVGSNEGQISNAHATGTVTASGDSNSSNIAGGLVGYNDFNISNAYATGNVTASGTNNYYLEAGGLVGANSGQISNARATGAVTASGDSNSGSRYYIAVTAGGLVGYNDSSISNAHATGNVTASGNSNSTNAAGGLVGSNAGRISNAHATGTVTASGDSNSNNTAGGLTGYNDSSISNAYATGQVTASGTNNYYLEAGGLAGSNLGPISNAYATGQVTASGTNNYYLAAGGLVGLNLGPISNAYATGQVTAKGNSNTAPNGYKAVTAGGLVGYKYSSITNVYATGAVAAGGSNNAGLGIGGLVGSNVGDTISYAYATGDVRATGTSNGPVDSGGLVGYNGSNTTISSAYWDKSTTGASHGIGNNQASSSNTGVTGLTDSKMEKQSSFSGFDFTNNPVWIIYNDHTKPLLDSFLTPLTVSGGPTSKTYGQTVARVLSDYTYSKSSALTSGYLKAQIGNATTSNGELIKAGNHTPVFYSNQQGYDITNKVSSSLTIKPKQLSAKITGNPTKTYDGHTNATIPAGDTSLSGFVGNQGASASSKQLNGTYSQSGAGSNIKVSAKISASDFSSNSNTSLSNYTLPNKATGTGTIKPKQLSAQITGNPTKTYDGSNGATIPAGDTSLSGFVGSQSATSKQISGTYGQSGAGSNIKVSAKISASDFSSNSNTSLSNYTLPNKATGTGTITPKQLSAQITGNPTKTYDGSNGATIPAGDTSLSGFVGSQSATSKQISGTYSRSGAGSNITVSENLGANDFTAGNKTSLANYKLPNTASGTGTIQPRQLTAQITGNPTKLFDGTTTASLTPSDYTLNGLVNGQNITVTQRHGTYAQAAVGQHIAVRASLSKSDFKPGKQTALSNYALPTRAIGTGTIKAQPNAIRFVPISSILGTRNKRVTTGTNNHASTTKAVYIGPPNSSSGFLNAPYLHIKDGGVKKSY